MTLVFALAAAVCLGCFAKAGDISRHTARREQAAILAQNAAETIKFGGDPMALPVPDGYAVQVTDAHSDVPGLYQAAVEVYYEGELLFSLTAAGQEALP